MICEVDRFERYDGGSVDSPEYSEDAVVMVEDTELVSSEQDANGRATEEKEVKILVQAEARENVRLPGSDVKKGDMVSEVTPYMTPLLII